MKITTIGAIAALFFTLGACASDPASDEPELVVDGEEYECRRIKQIGSNLGEKVCGSAEQWAERDAAEKEAADRTSGIIQERGIGSSPSPRF